MNTKSTDEQYSDEEATKRMNDALRRALTTPPKPRKAVIGEGAKAPRQRSQKPVKKHQE